MTEERLKDAFGRTPLSVQYRVKNALNGPKEGTIMKKKISVVLIAALVTVALLGGVAIAKTDWGVMEFLGWQSGGRAADTGSQLASKVQTVAQNYDGEAVRIDVTDAVYDSAGGVYALAWTLENKTPGTEYYIICDGITFDEEKSFARSMANVSEFFLGDEAVKCGVCGEVPETGGKNVELTFTILKALAEHVEIDCEWDAATEEDARKAEFAYQDSLMKINAEGKIAVAGDGFIELGEDGWAEGESYAEALVHSGKFELAEHFTLSFPLRDDSMDDMKKVYTGKTDFKFDGYELHVRKAEITPLSAHFTVDYISDEKPGDGGKGVGPLWEICFAIDDKSPADGLPYDSYWGGQGSGDWGDEIPVQLDDGRWLSTYNYEMFELHVWPEEIKMFLITYSDGETLEPTYHLDDVVTLKFE